VRVQDSRLGHPPGRDDVRRDSSYDHAMSVVRRVIEEQLPERASVRLRELAESGHDGEYRALVDALLTCNVEPPAWHFPLLEPRGDAKTIAAKDLDMRVWGSSRSSRLTETMANEGTVVLRSTDTALIRRALHRSARTLHDADAELTLAVPVEKTDADIALLEIVRELFAHVHREPAEIVLVELVGAYGNLLSVGLRDASTRLVSSADVTKNPFAFFGRRTLALSTVHPHVEAARTSPDLVLAAGHIARAVLLQHSILDREKSERLLERTLVALGVES